MTEPLMWMLVDDQRDLNCELIARTSQVAMKIIPWIFDELECLVLDHDLGEESYHDGNMLLKQLIDSNWLPSRVQICSANPVGLENMTNQLTDFGYKTIDGRNFTK